MRGWWHGHIHGGEFLKRPKTRGGIQWCGDKKAENWRRQEQNSRCKTTMHTIWDKIQCWLFKRLLIIAQWKLWHVLFINTYISISTNSFVSSCTRGRLCFLWPLTVFPAWSRISGLIVTRFDICAGRLLFVLVDDYLCCLRIICAGWYIVKYCFLIVGGCWLMVVTPAALTIAWKFPIFSFNLKVRICGQTI